MLRLAMVLFSLIATTLAGSAVVIALVAGYTSAGAIVAAAALGAAVAVPVSLAVARNLTAD